MQPWVNAVRRSIDHCYDEMLAVRRHMHAHPELSGQEHDTSLYLYQRLSEHDFDVRIGPEGRGVVADQAPGRQKPVNGLLALRADIDALRIHDQKKVEYQSQCRGVMHACGHDVHAAICFGTFMALHDLQQDDRLPWPVNVRSIFQPAEETCAGAEEMIDAGALDDVQAILALHVDPTRRIGSIGVRDGVLTANCDAMTIRITGRGGHAARPHEATDPIAAGAQLINSLYMFVPRHTDSQDAVVITIGQISGAETQNIIPEWIELGGTLRTLDHQVRRRTIDHIRQLADGIGKMSSTDINVVFGVASGSVENDHHLVSIICQAANWMVGKNHIDEILRPSMGSEDFAFYLDHVPGAMFRLGCASDKVGQSPLHSPSFDVDEEALRIGARILCTSAILWSKPSAAQTSYDI